MYKPGPYLIEKVSMALKDQYQYLMLLPESREVMEHFKSLFGPGNSDPAKILPLKIWTSKISFRVSPNGILPRTDLQFRPGRSGRSVGV